MKGSEIQRFTFGLLAAALLLAVVALPAFAQERVAPSVEVDFIPTTQGPIWPPAEVTDEDGNFVVVGLILREVSPGVVVPSAGAALVSKDTVPPLGPDGKEDFSDPFAAPYDIIRELDLSPGSPDLDIELYTNSYGPAKGDFGGGPRIPREGDSLYNLNQLPASCVELFPSSAQEEQYTLARFPLQKTPIWGFRGDQVAYDVNTGEGFVPNLGSGSDCPPEGCAGEDQIDVRPQEPVTLGRHLQSRGQVKITLTQFDEELDAYTHARFNFKFSGLLPNRVHTVWALRAQVLEQGVLPGPLAIPNILVSDLLGRARGSFEIPHPFPDPDGPDHGLRLVGLGFALHPDYQNWGACFGRLGAGVDITGVMSTVATGQVGLADFITKAPSE